MSSGLLGDGLTTEVPRVVERLTPLCGKYGFVVPEVESGYCKAGCHLPVGLLQPIKAVRMSTCIPYSIQYFGTLVVQVPVQKRDRLCVYM